MKLHLVDQIERNKHLCFYCARLPAKYRVSLYFPKTDITLYRVHICNRCALIHMDDIIDSEE